MDPSKAKAELFADGVFVLEHDKGKKIHVHVERRFLAVESPGYFRPLFFGRFEESRMDAVPVHDVSVGDFLHLLSIVYNPKPVCYAESSEEELLGNQRRVLYDAHCLSRSFRLRGDETSLFAVLAKEYSQLYDVSLVEDLLRNRRSIPGS